MSDRQQKSRHTCLSCGATDWYENQSFGALPRVTSDSASFPAQGRICICLQCGLIQKIIDARWKSEIEVIYRDYKMYELTDGADQVLFDEGGKTRAQKMVEILSGQILDSFSGSVLDIGCGTGGFLKAFGGAFPQASLYGQEIDSKNLRYLERIPNFKTLFTSQAPYNGQTFDVIVSIHCFEHLYDYASFFREIKTIRKDSARILLQVPDVESSPFDIVVADHAAHFSQNTLQRCLNQYLNEFIISKPINKELTALASQTSQSVEPPALPAKEDCIRTLDAHVNYLIRLLEYFDDRQLSEFGVYGTTIAGAWLTAAYGDRIAFYVDDDPLKQGKLFYNKNIISADQVPNHCKVLMPSGITTIRKILSNHPHLLPLAVYCE